MKIRFYRAPADDDTGGDGGGRPTPAEINQQQNRARLSRIEQIARGNDGRRAAELDDVEGERVTGRFESGELDESPEARERAAELEEENARQALAEAEEAAARADAEDAEGEARRLQAEGLDDHGEPPARGRQADPEGAQAGDEKVVNGVRYYLTIVSGKERWLTLAQLRAEASKAASADETLQKAHEALQRSTQAALSPKPEPVAPPDREELELVLSQAIMGDADAISKLATTLSRRPSAEMPDVSRQVSQQIATQRAIDAAERSQADVLGHRTLAPIFRQRLREFAQESPETPISDAYEAVGKAIRADFAPMLSSSNQPADKATRKRSLVNPPVSSGRARQPMENEAEEPVSSQIDAVARARGQSRAIRQSRR